MMTKRKFLTPLVQVGIIIFWIIVIGIFLSLGNIASWFTRPRAISILTWTYIIDEQKVKEFEKKTGITVYLNYFESNEELLAKLHFSKEGYDLVIPSDFMTQQLIQKGMLKKLDPQQVAPILKTIKRELLGHYFDPHNEYSIPCLWDIYGIGVNKTYFGNTVPPATWKLIFDKQLTPGHVAMTNDPREAILLAAQYLFGTIDNLDEKKLELVEELLLQQKKWVEAYTDLRADYLLASGTSPVAVLPIAYVMRSLRFFNYLSFVLPEQTFILIDSFVIPTTSKRDDLVYEFINYLLQPEVAQYHFHAFGFLPPRTDTFDVVDIPQIDLKKLNWKKLEFFRNVIQPARLNAMWRTIKAM